MDLSIVIPFIHEFPALIHTVFSIQNELLDLPYEWEIIIVENREQDSYTEKFLHYMRALVDSGRLRYFFEPRPCGPIARNTGARNARGEYLLFTDAHVQFGKNTVPLLIETMEAKRDAGIVHGSTVWSHYDSHHSGCHYKLFGGGGPTLFSHMHGTYQRCRDASEPYLVAGGSLAYVLFRRKNFLNLRGYNENCRFYPHPEGYLPLKFWMFGWECWLHPKAFHYHSLYPRNRGSPPETKISIDGAEHCLTWNDHTIRNAMICAFALGGEEWLNNVFREWSHRGAKTTILNWMRKDALEKGLEDRDWIEKNSVYSLNEVLRRLHLRGVKGAEVLPF